MHQPHTDIAAKLVQQRCNGVRLSSTFWCASNADCWPDTPRTLLAKLGTQHVVSMRTAARACVVCGGCQVSCFLGNWQHMLLKQCVSGIAPRSSKPATDKAAAAGHCAAAHSPKKQWWLHISARTRSIRLCTAAPMLVAELSCLTLLSPHMAACGLKACSCKHARGAGPHNHNLTCFNERLHPRCVHCTLS